MLAPTCVDTNARREGEMSIHGQRLVSWTLRNALRLRTVALSSERMVSFDIVADCSKTVSMTSPETCAHKKSSRKVRSPRGAEDDALLFREPVVRGPTKPTASLLRFAEHVNRNFTHSTAIDTSVYQILVEVPAPTISLAMHGRVKNRSPFCCQFVSEPSTMGGE